MLSPQKVKGDFFFWFLMFLCVCVEFISISSPLHYIIKRKRKSGEVDLERVLVDTPPPAKRHSNIILECMYRSWKCSSLDNTAKRTQKKQEILSKTLDTRSYVYIDVRSWQTFIRTNEFLTNKDVAKCELCVCVCRSAEGPKHSKTESRASLFYSIYTREKTLLFDIHRKTHGKWKRSRTDNTIIYRRERIQKVFRCFEWLGGGSGG